MKKIYILLLLAFSISSCDSFLDKNPKHKLAEDEFFESERDLELYSNSFLSRIPSLNRIVFGDQYSDYIATRSSTPFLIGNTWTPNQQGNWGGGDSGKWSQLRHANYFLDKLKGTKGKVSDEIYLHYEGVGRFWRAWFYYDMVTEFGDVPWYDHELDPEEVDELYKGRDSRAYVMDKVLEDLTFAAENCSASAKFVSSSTRINKWTALAFKTRVCLYEGTYRKYHKELNLTDSSKKFLEEAVKAAEELMESSPFRLVDDAGNRSIQYRNLFSSTDLNTTEVIFGLDYDQEMRRHETTWDMFSATKGLNWSFSKQFVNQYLMQDGSRFTDQPNYKQVEFINEFANRDLRMVQTMVHPGYKRKSLAGNMVEYAPDFRMNFTGYQPIKWALDDDAHIGKATSDNALPIFRFAEVLLNLAEAKAELGEMDEQVWNKTIKPLRERAGVNGKSPETADPYLVDYYRKQTTDKWILEVRRERNIELAFEGVRPDDLMRWKLGELFAIDWEGLYIPEKGKVYDLNGDGKGDLAVVDKKPAKPVSGVVYIELGTAHKLDENNHLLFGWAQNRVWADRMYLRPIPQQAVQDNPNLLPQNPGWE